MLAPWKKSYDQPRQYIRKQRHYFADKVYLVKATAFPVVMYGCESWTVKKAEHWRIDAFKLWCWRRLLKSPLDCKEIQLVHPKGNQSWIFIGRTDAQSETPTLWPPHAKNWFTGKDPDAGKDWRQEKGTTENEMVGWHHRLNEHESEQGPGVGDGQGGPVCCSPWGCKVRQDWATELNWSALDWSCSGSLTTTELLSQLLFPADAWIREWTLQYLDMGYFCLWIYIIGS